MRMVQRGAAPVGAILLVFLAYLNILHNEFVYDDGSQILQNRWLTDNNLGAMFSSNVWGHLGPHAVSNYYRPFMHILYWLCFRMFHYQSFGYHTVSLTLHAVCVWLVWTIGVRLGLRDVAAGIAAILFAVHPIHTEAVDWVSASNELAYSLFVLLAI